MLDDLKLIHELDAQDALGVAEKQWQQLQHDYHMTVPDFGDINNIVLGGMGGSAWPAVFLKSWPGLLVPFEIVRDYTLPDYVGSKTLFISSSYSGNTEETISAIGAAEAKGAKIVVITAGGKLAEIAREKNYPMFVIPSGIQPRMCCFYFLAAFIQLLQPLQLIAPDKLGELQETGQWLKDQTATWKATVPVKDNPAKQLALELIGKSIVVYSGPKLFPAANKLKISMNENAKNIAWVNQFPEFNHNEFIGWSSHPVHKPYAVIEFRSNLEHERVQKRFIVTERLLSGLRPEPHVINPPGDTVLHQLLWSAMFGDFTSLYVSLLNGLNPTPVALVEKLKQLLDE